MLVFLPIYHVEPMQIYKNEMSSVMAPESATDFLNSVHFLLIHMLNF